MQTYGSSVVPMIEANYEMFTVVEKTIADFFISNEKEMDFIYDVCVHFRTWRMWKTDSYRKS